MIEQTRYCGFVEIIEYYLYHASLNKCLSKQQKEQLQETCNELDCFGETGQEWANLGREILIENN